MLLAARMGRGLRAPSERDGKTHDDVTPSTRTRANKWEVRERSLSKSFAAAAAAKIGAMCECRVHSKCLPAPQSHSDQFTC